MLMAKPLRLDKLAPVELVIIRLSLTVKVSVSLVIVVPLTVKLPVTVKLPSKVLLPLLSNFAFKAVCVAVETGLSASEVLLTFDKPTCACVTLWGLLSSAMWSAKSSVTAVTLPLMVSNAACVAVDIGLSKSEVLSTLPNLTCAFVTSWGLFLLAICAFTVD